MAKKAKKDKVIAYWDSNLFIKWFKGDGAEDHWADVDTALSKAKDGELLIVTSALTLAEVVKIDGARKLSKETRELVEKLFNEPYIEKIGITPITGEFAQRLVWDYNIDPKDAIHVAAAIERRVPIFHCYDGGLKNKGQKHVKTLLDFDMTFEEPLQSLPDAKFEQKRLDFDGKSADGNGRVQPSLEADAQPKAQKPKRRVTTQV